jgi:hypothetical protein
MPTKRSTVISGHITGEFVRRIVSASKDQNLFGR